jgi:hypothetical protein
MVLRRGGARAARIWSAKEKGDEAAMAALIATREREGGGLGASMQRSEKKGGLGVDGEWSGGGCGMRPSNVCGSPRVTVSGRARERRVTGEVREGAGR